MVRRRSIGQDGDWTTWAGLSAEDRLVFQEVERASTAGISTKDLKTRANLQTQQLARVLKKLEAGEVEFIFITSATSADIGVGPRQVRAVRVLDDRRAAER